MAHTQLLVYEFTGDADFAGRLLGALERLESGGALRVLDALFLHRAADTGELSAFALRGHSSGFSVAPLLDFRLDRAARRRSTRDALSDGGVERLAAGVRSGSAIAAVLVEHVWAAALEDAVARTGGTPLASEFVEAAALKPELLAAYVPS